MAQFGLEQHCIADTELSGKKLIELFNRINENLDQISEKEQETAFRMYEQVKGDFSEMVPCERKIEFFVE